MSSTIEQEKKKRKSINYGQMFGEIRDVDDVL